MVPAEENESDESPAKQNCCPATRWLEIALLLAVFFIVGGAPAPHVNETYYLTKAKHYWDPQWCAGDMFLESADAHLTFYWTVGWLAKWFSLPTMAWIGRVAAWFLLAVSWQRLSSRVVQRPFFAVLTAMLFVTLIDQTNFAGEWVVGGVEGKCFAYAFAFWGLAALAEGRWRAMWPWFGLASALHVLVGGWATIAAGLVWLVEPRGKRASLRSMLPALLLGGTLALPGVVPALQLTRGVSTEDAAEANQIYVFQRLPHHLAPLALPSKELTKKALRYGSMVICFALLWLLARKKNAFDEGVSPALNRLMRFAWGSLALSAFGLAWELANWDRPELAAGLLKYYWFRLADIAVPLAAALAIAWLASVMLERRPKWAALLLLVAISFPSWHLFSLSTDRYQNSIPPADRKIKDHVAWKEACQWVRENTPSDSLFLVPRGSQSFEWYAHRKALVTWKDVPQDAASLIKWRDCYFDVFSYKDKDGGQRSSVALADQGAERIGHLAEKYQADYVVTKEYPPLLLPTVHKNNSFRIYATRPTTKETSP